MNLTKAPIASIAAVSAVLIAMPFTANAQTKVLKKHSTAAAVGAGLVAHHYAKKGAAARVASGKKPNFAERHPVLTGVAAGAATHHMLKKKN